MLLSELRDIHEETVEMGYQIAALLESIAGEDEVLMNQLATHKAQHLETISLACKVIAQMMLQKEQP